MAQKSRNSIAVVWVMRMGGGSKGMIDSCTHTNMKIHILYRPRGSWEYGEGACELIEAQYKWGAASRFVLAFPRYCHYQYCMACIAIKDGRGETLYCAILWVMKGMMGVPKQRGCLQIIVLIRVQKPRNKIIGCEG